MGRFLLNDTRQTHYLHLCPFIFLTWVFKENEKRGQAFVLTSWKLFLLNAVLCFSAVAIYNLWEYACQKKLVALSACHNLYRQSMWSEALLINTSCLFLFSDSDRSRVHPLTRYLACDGRQQNPPFSFSQGKYHLSVLSPVYPHRHTLKHMADSGTAVLPATSSLSFPPLVSMETSFQSWLVSDRCESAQTKKGRGGRGGWGVSLCLNMTTRTLQALVTPRWSKCPTIHAFRCEKERIKMSLFETCGRQCGQPYWYCTGASIFFPPPFLYSSITKEHHLISMLVVHFKAH